MPRSVLFAAAPACAAAHASGVSIAVPPLAAARGLMILTLSGIFGSVVSLDFTNRFGDAVELQCFQFVMPPIEFRLVRQGVPLQEWQAGNNDMYDLQHEMRRTAFDA